MSLSTLPGELYEPILSHVPSHSIQQTVLALSRALPYAPIPQQGLFSSIRIKRADQLPKLYLRLRSSNDEHNRITSWVQFFALECWNADPEILLDIIHLLPNLRGLNLWVGPLNFKPEHLEELLDITKLSKGNRCLACVGNLKDLSIRFKPYVEKATYHQFLQGSYFDSTLYALARWPKALLPSLSIAQDPFNQQKHTSVIRGNSLGFAQPLVFFQIDPALAILLRSPTIRATLTSLRFRIPGRNILAFTQPPPPNPPSFGALRPANDSSDSEEEAERIRQLYTHEYARLTASPHLTLLDVATTAIPGSNISSILGRFPSLRHLIMDKCGLLPGELCVRNHCGEWAALAKSLATAGSYKAQEREEKVTQWLERLCEYKRAQAGSVEAAGSSSSANNLSRAKKTKKGRKGVATATISLRKEELPSPPPFLQPENMKNSLTLPIIGGGPGVPKRPINPRQKIRILPTIPTLRSFATDVAPLHPAASNVPAREALFKVIRTKWEEGWAEGVAQLVKKRQLLRASWKNNTVRVVRFADPHELRQLNQDHSGEAFGDTEEGLDGLVDIYDAEEFDVDLADSNGCGKSPTLCLEGTGRFVEGHSHLDECGHILARNIWGDEWDD